MKRFAIVKSGCFHTAPQTVRLKKTLLPHSSHISRYIHRSSVNMHPNDFYSIPVKVLKSSQPRSPSKIDAEDLMALEESFSDDEGSSLHVTDVKPVLNSSPIKAHNRQFENDFEIDLSEEEDSLESVSPGKENREPSSKLGKIVKEFSSSPAIQRSTPKIKVSQINQSFENPAASDKQNKIIFEEDFEDSLEDTPPVKEDKMLFEEDFQDSFEEEEEDRSHLVKSDTEPIREIIKQETVAPGHGSSSASTSSFVFTSSPSYHRYETVNKRFQDSHTESAQVQLPDVKVKTEAGNGNRVSLMLNEADEDFENDPFPELSNEAARNELYPELPPIQSTPKDFANLYPTMDSYEVRYKTDSVQVEDLQPAELEPQPQASNDFFDGARFKKPTVKCEASKSIPNLLNKPKKRNAEILLLTQRPQLHEMNQADQVRNASTTTRPDRTPPPGQTGKVVQPFSLSEEQQHVVDLAKRGISLFYTGSAGTGKSVLLRSMIKTLRAMHPPDTVAVTASTGLAACNIGGVTLHSFAGIGLGKESVTDLMKKIRRSRKTLDRWRSIKVLVIDEISMIDGGLFDKLDSIAKLSRRNDKPFGGIQVIVCGDFFQLPPVSKKDEEPATFCFDSKSWKECIKLTITLEQVFRQKGDMDFINMLNELRIGRLSTKTIDGFLQLARELPPNEIEPAELYCTRYEVDRANTTRLSTLKSDLKTYNAQDHSTLSDPQQIQRMLANFMAPQKLHLKKGAQVMMIKNIDESLVNGSLGKVIDFVDTATYQTYERIIENNELEDSEIEKAIEKSKEESQKRAKEDQENAIDRLEESVFEFFRDLPKDDPEVLRNIKMKKDLMNRLHESSTGRKLPLVKFLTPDGTSRTVLVNPEKWEVEDEHEKPLVTRIQVPLILAWALSIHKSQGQTLPRVRVNLKRVFEKGQAYVALSRAVSRDGLQVLHFDPSRVTAHSRVIEFYAQLKSALDAKKMYEGFGRPVDLFQRDIKNARSASIEDYLDEEAEDKFVDAPSPTDFENSGILMATQDDSADNIVVSRRNFSRKRGRDQYL